MPQPTDGGFTFTPQELALMGFYLFPCQGKQPLVKWRDKSTTELPTIERWIKRYPGCWWGVDCGKSGLAVLDDDRGKNRQAIASLLDLTLQYGELPDTFTVRTPTTGFHYYMRGHCRNSASDEKKLGAGLDSRGDGGYVIAPCSPGYVALSADKKIAAAPEWFIELTNPREPQKRSITDVSTVLDTDAAVKRAIEYLEAAMPAIEGQGGDAHTYKVACAVRDFGISPDLCLELMLEHWDYRNEPPWGEELAVKVDNAYSYAENSVGSLDPASVFDEFIDDEPAPEGQASPYKPLTRDQIMAMPPVEWIVDGIMPTRGVGQVYGQSRAGKSFLSFDMALAIAAGAGQWFGYDIDNPRPVTYLMLEGQAGLRQRIEAWELHTGKAMPEAFEPIIQDWSITSPQKIKQLAAACKKGAVIFIDTQTQAAATIQENTSEGMGAILMGAKKLADLVEGFVVLITHSGKDISKGPRGHSSQIPAADMVIEVTYDHDKDRGAWVAVKVKDGRSGMVHGFRRAEVLLGETAKRKPITSCIIEAAELDTCDTGGIKLSKFANEMWQSLKFLSSGSKSGWVRGLEWMEDVGSSRNVTKVANLKTYFSKGLRELIEGGLVTRKNKDFYAPTALTAVDSDD